jgi:hypothetical protein
MVSVTGDLIADYLSELRTRAADTGRRPALIQIPVSHGAPGRSTVPFRMLWSRP